MVKNIKFFSFIHPKKIIIKGYLFFGVGVISQAFSVNDSLKGTPGVLQNQSKYREKNGAFEITCLQVQASKLHKSRTMTNSLTD